MPEMKGPYRTDTERCNHRPRAELRLVVTVIPHGIVAVAIEVTQNAIERYAGDLLCYLAEWEQDGSPW